MCVFIFVRVTKRTQKLPVNKNIKKKKINFRIIRTNFKYEYRLRGYNLKIGLGVLRFIR